MRSTRSDVEPFRCLVRKEFLFDMKSHHGEFVSARVIGVTSYAGHIPTFDVELDEGFLFHYLPVHALAWKECEPATIQSTSYFNCPVGGVEVTCLTALDSRKCQIFGRDGQLLGSAVYVMTFDWVDSNELCHLLRRDDGNHLLWPSHKVAFSDVTTLPGYRKLRAMFKLNASPLRGTRR